MENCKHHPDYSNEIPRLNRIAGQVNGIKKMAQYLTYCRCTSGEIRRV